MFLEIFIMAFVGAAIGWLTNYIAIRLLFRPFLPWKIPFTGLAIQGLIPGRRKEIAVSIGKTVEERLFSMQDVLAKILGQDQKNEIVDIISSKIIRRAGDKMPALIPNGIKKAVLSYISGIIDKEAGELLEYTIEQAVRKAAGRLDLGKMVEDRLDDLDMAQLEALILPIAGRELKHIEVLGGVMGFIIGLVQGVFIGVL